MKDELETTSGVAGSVSLNASLLLNLPHVKWKLSRVPRLVIIGGSKTAFCRVLFLI